MGAYNTTMPKTTMNQTSGDLPKGCMIKKTLGDLDRNRYKLSNDQSARGSLQQIKFADDQKAGL